MKIKHILIFLFSFSGIFLSGNLTANDVVFPVNWDGVNGNPDPISCDEDYPEDDYGNPDPDLTGYPESSDCGNLGISYDDNTIPLCGPNSGSFKVIREWVVVDWCSGQTHFHDQIIKILDMDAPELTGGNSVTVSVGTNNCYYVLDGDDFELSITDNCDYNVDFQFIPPEGSNLSKGTHVVTVQAIDDCSNVANYDVILYVEDHIPPIAVVDNSFNVSLSSNGTGYIYKTAFDEGSHDQCGPVTFEVRRIGNNPCGLSTEWGHGVDFCCEDVPISPVLVEFRVLDHSGNSNTSWIEVNVEDKLTPNINCPGDRELECLDDYYSIISNAGVNYDDLPTYVKNTLGKPTFTAGCSANLSYTVQTDLDLCETSTLNVTWIVQSNSGQSDGCLQVVSIVRNEENKLNCDDITFPAGSQELIVYGAYPWCAVNDNQNDPDDDIPAIQINDCGEANINYPILDNNQLCTSIGFSQNLDTFLFADGVCKKILSHWEVIDFCSFDENFVDPITGEINPFHSDNGYFEFFAEYDIFDNTGPEVECNLDYVVDCTEDFTGPITASATDNCSDSESFGWSWKWDEDNDGDIDDEGAGSELTASSLGFSSFPLGEHRIIWNVNDGCGNNTNESCIISISEEDDKPPTPYCHLGLSTVLMEGSGEVTLWATDFDAGSFDNCTLQENLSFSFSPIFEETSKTFDCFNIGFNFIQLFVKDESGNQDFCTAFLTIFDNGHCANISSMVGRVMMENEVTVPGVDVSLYIDNTLDQETISDSEGNYSFESHWYENAVILANRDGIPLNGVNTQDIIEIQRHILGSDAFNSAYQLIAADINDSGNISMYDIVHLRRLLLGYYEEFPENKPWKFLRTGLSLEELNSSIDYEEGIQLNEVIGSLDLIAVKTGDVNASSEVDGLVEAETREATDLYYTVKAQSPSNYLLSFGFKDIRHLEGLQLEVEFDDELVTIESVLGNVLDLAPQFYHLRENKLSISFNSPAPVNISDADVLFDIQVSGKLGESQIFELSEQRIKAEWYSQNIARSINIVESRDPIGDEIFISDPSPNPFSDKTRISFQIPGKTVSASIFDVYGKKLFTEELILEKGEQEWVISNERFNRSGLYHIVLKSEKFRISKKLLYIE